MARVLALFLVFLAVVTVLISVDDQAEALTVIIFRRRRSNASQKKQQRKIASLKKTNHLLKKALKAEKKVLKVHFLNFISYFIDMCFSLFVFILHLCRSCTSMDRASLSPLRNQERTASLDL